MAHCININHPEYKKLVPQFKGPEDLLKAKISIWQENNGLDNFPTIDQLEERKNILYDKMSIEEKIQDKLKVSEEDILGRFLSKEQVRNTQMILSNMTSNIVNRLGISKEEYLKRNKIVYEDKDIDSSLLQSYNVNYSKLNHLEEGEGQVFLQANQEFKNTKDNNPKIKKLNLSNNSEDKWIVKYLMQSKKGKELQNKNTKEEIINEITNEFNLFEDRIKNTDDFVLTYLSDEYVDSMIEESTYNEEDLQMWTYVKNNKDKFIKEKQKEQREALLSNFTMLKHTEHYPIAFKLMLMEAVSSNYYIYNETNVKSFPIDNKSHRVVPIFVELILAKLEEKAALSSNKIMYDYFYELFNQENTLIDLNNYKNNEYLKTENGIWYKFNKGSDSMHFCNMSVLSQGTPGAWCTGNPKTARDYLDRNDIYIFYNLKKNKPTLQLALGEKDEIGGLGSSQDVLDEDLVDLNNILNNYANIKSKASTIKNYNDYKNVLKKIKKGGGSIDFLSYIDFVKLIEAKQYYKDNSNDLETYKRLIPKYVYAKYYNVEENDIIFTNEYNINDINRDKKIIIGDFYSNIKELHDDKKLFKHCTGDVYLDNLTIATTKLFDSAGGNIYLNNLTIAKTKLFDSAVGGVNLNSLTIATTKLFDSAGRDVYLNKLKHLYSNAITYDKNKLNELLSLLENNTDKDSIIKIQQKIKDLFIINNNNSPKRIEIEPYDGYFNKNTFNQGINAAIIKAPKNSSLTVFGKNSNITTAIHEKTHEYENVLSKNEISIIEKWSGYKKGSKQFSESFAKGAEKYIYDGNLADSSSEIGTIFEKFKQWFKELIESAIAYFGDINELNEDIKNLYHKMFILQNANEIKSEEKIQDENINKNEVQYNLKAVNILLSDKAKQIFEKGNKNNWSIDKILQELAIPKEQKELVKQSYLDGNKTPDDIAMDIISKYSFTVEINIAKEGTDFYGAEDFQIEGTRYYTVTGEKFYKIENNYANNFNKEIIEINFKEFENAAKQYKDINEVPTSHYKNLTVPGGTNYTENRIITPNITPSIKGHPQFAEDNDIGWFRSDEQTTAPTYKFGNFEIEETKEGKYILKDTDKNIIIDTYDDVDEAQNYIINYRQNFVSGVATKTRRILEIQSDLFQKGRNKEDLTFKVYPGFEGEPIETSDEKGNQFLQLLNKDNNWVTFFIKSIIQDSAKKGYKKVLFPKGETAAKIEGHETIADEIRKVDTKIKDLKNRFKIDFGVIENGKDEGMWYGYDKPYKNKQFAERSWTYAIEQLEQKKANLKSQGIEKLKPVEAFYEIKVTNILKKLGNINEVIDEYGNGWNEVTITPAHRNTILLQKGTNAKFDNEIKKIYDKLEMYSYDEYIPAIKYSNAVHLIQQYNRDNNNSNYELAMKRYYNRTSKIVVQPKSLIESKENNLLTKDEGNIRMTINDLFKKVDKDVQHEMEIALKNRVMEIKKVNEVPSEFSIMKVADLHHKELTKQYGALEGTIKYFEEITALNKRFDIKEFLNKEELMPFEKKLDDYNANNPGNSHFYQKLNLPTNDKRDKYIFKINFTKVENIADQQNTIISNIEEDNSISLDNKQEEKTDEEIKQELLAKKDFEKKAENIKENIIQYGNVQGKEFSQQKIIFPEDINLTDTQKSMLMNFDAHFPNHSFLTLVEKMLFVEALGDGDIIMYCKI